MLRRSSSQTRPPIQPQLRHMQRLHIQQECDWEYDAQCGEMVQRSKRTLHAQGTDDDAHTAAQGAVRAEQAEHEQVS